jgi:hypothetical protein
VSKLSPLRRQDAKGAKSAFFVRLGVLVTGISHESLSHNNFRWSERDRYPCINFNFISDESRSISDQRMVSNSPIRHANDSIRQESLMLRNFSVNLNLPTDLG